MELVLVPLESDIDENTPQTKGGYFPGDDTKHGRKNKMACVRYIASWPDTDGTTRVTFSLPVDFNAQNVPPKIDSR